MQKNNLKQIGLAWLNHENTFGVFPSGGMTWLDSGTRTWIAPGVPGDYKTQSWGWGYQILPYLEQENLWSPSTVDHGPLGTPGVSGTPVSLYICRPFEGPSLGPITN